MAVLVIDQHHVGCRSPQGFDDRKRAHAIAHNWCLDDLRAHIKPTPLRRAAKEVARMKHTDHIVRLAILYRQPRMAPLAKATDDRL